MSKCTLTDLQNEIKDKRTVEEQSILDSYEKHIQEFSEFFANRVNTARANGSKIKGFFDFDADGVMSALEMTRIVPDIDVHIGDRYIDGYGIPQTGLDKLEKGDLVICGDMGSTEEDKVMKIKEITGNYPIIIDHHEVSEAMEKYPYMLNFNKKTYGIPMEKRPDWCTAGLVKEISKNFTNLKEWDKSAITIYSTFATIADVVKMNNPYDTNRENVKLGFQLLEQKEQIDANLFFFLHNTGLLAKPHILTKSIQFDVNPLINAPGRIGTISDWGTSGGQFVYDTLNPSSNIDRDEAFFRIQELFAINDKRKDMEKLAMRKPEYLDSLKKALSDNIVVCYLPELNKGICGRIAQRLASECKKPAICFCGNDKEGLSGSARTVKGYPEDMLGIVSKTIEQLGLDDKVGGHPQAFGFSKICEADIPKIKSALDRVYDDITPVKAEVRSVDLKSVSIDGLIAIEPFGPDFPQPVAEEYLKIGEVRPLKNDYVKLYAERNKKIAFFGSPNIPMNKDEYLHVIGDIQVNYWGNDASLQISLDDVETSKTPFILKDGNINDNNTKTKDDDLER